MKTDNSHEPATKGDLIDGLTALKTELNQKIDSVETGLNKKIGSVETGLNKKIGSVETGLNKKIDSVETGLNQKIGSVETGLNEKIKNVYLEVIKLQSRVGNIEEKMSTKDDISRVLNAIDKFVGEARDYRRRDLERGHMLMVQGDKLHDHEKRITMLETGK